MADTASYLFYAYWDHHGHGISQDVLETYSSYDKTTMIFDTYNRSIYAYGGVIGHHQLGTYHGEIFNDFIDNNAKGDYSSAHGYCTYAGNDHEMAIGHYNEYVEGTLFSVGNGNSESRSNALEVHSDVTYIKTPAYINGDEVAVMSYVTKELNDKVDKEEGKGLSTNDFTTSYLEKLNGIEEGAEKNVQADWGEDNNESDSYIKNKPANLVSMANRDTAYYIWVGSEDEYEELPQKYSNIIYIVTDNEEEQELPEYVPQNG